MVTPNRLVCVLELAVLFLLQTWERSRRRHRRLLSASQRYYKLKIGSSHDECGTWTVKLTTRFVLASRIGLHAMRCANRDFLSSESLLSLGRPERRS